jgi:hypothetical protein
MSWPFDVPLPGQREARPTHRPEGCRAHFGGLLPDALSGCGTKLKLVNAVQGRVVTLWRKLHRQRPLARSAELPGDMDKRVIGRGLADSGTHSLIAELAHSEARVLGRSRECRAVLA